jgi:predicted Kef-type K+ transport protein
MMDFSEILGNAIVNGLAEIISETINVVLRKLGYSEIETKRTRRYIVWIIVTTLIMFLFWLTIHYS